MENHFWAYGSGGILLSRILIRKYYCDEIMVDEFKIALNNIINKGVFLNHNYTSCLFCNIDVINQYHNTITEIDDFENIRKNLCKVLDDKKANDNWACSPVGVNNAFYQLNGLFTGLAGIENTLLSVVSFNKTKKIFSIILILILITSYLSAQNQTSIEIKLTGAIDTSNIDIKNIVKLYHNYINSNPDSIGNYTNPNWETSEKNIILDKGAPSFDLAAPIMFRSNLKASDFYSIFPPQILSIDKIADSLYTIRTLFYSNEYASDSIYGKWNPLYITKYYCVKIDSEFYLKNSISYETSFWNKLNYGCINYTVHPAVLFDTIAAVKSINFIDSICSTYQIEPPQNIDYYLAPNSEILGQLYNFTYILAPMSAITNVHLRQIYGIGKVVYNPHELTHVIFSNNNRNKTKIFVANEGIATFIGGSMGLSSFLEELKIFKNEIKDSNNLTFDDIIKRKYFHQYDSKPQYIVSGYLFYKVFLKHGSKGVLELFNSGENESLFIEKIEQLLNIKYAEFNYWIIEEIKNETIN